MKLKIIFGILFVLIIFFVILGYLSSYIGYTGYDKDKLRLYSSTKKESQDRDVFISDLHFHVDSIVIKEVFLERAYKGGENSLSETILLQKTDTFRNNNPELPFQSIVVFDEIQLGKRVFIPQYHLKLKDTILKDTLILEIHIRDMEYNFIKKEYLYIWK